MSNPGGKKQDDYQVYSLRNRSLTGGSHYDYSATSTVRFVWFSG